jgi:hypothetical protein
MSRSKSKVDRPLFVTIIGILYLLIGILVLLVGIAITVGVSLGDISLGDDVTGLAATVTGVIAICLALIYLVIGYGILKGWKVMWYLGVIFSILGIIIGILAFPVGIVAAVIEVVILYYLFRPGVKKFFNI